MPIKKTEVKQLLESNGAVVKKLDKEAEIYLLIGRDLLVSGRNYYHNRKYLFDDELIEHQDNELTFFPNLRADFYNMLRGLLERKDLYVHYISIGKPLIAGDFAKYEKKLKRIIPLAVKEFYSIFGHIQLLWDYSEPYVNRGVRAGKAWNLDSRDNHIGSIQILPLNTVLFENWDKYVALDEGQGVFDYYSEYYMTGLTLGETDNPTVCKGDDHGATFTDHSTMSFSDYIQLTLNMHGLKERSRYFVYYGSKNDPEITLEPVLKNAITIPKLG